MQVLKIKLLLFFIAIPLLLKAQEIEWREDRPLTWKDFQGKPDHNSGAAAVSYRAIIYDYKCELSDSIYVVTFNLKSVFYPKASWVQWQSVNDDYLLQHEQLHFDINELFTRKLAAAFHSAVYTSNYAAEIKAIYAKYWTECGMMEAKYDAETRHSNDRNMQYRWELFVYLELKNLPRNY